MNYTGNGVVRNNNTWNRKIFKTLFKINFFSVSKT